MTNKPFNAVDGYSVGINATINVIDANGNVAANYLTVTNTANITGNATFGNFIGTFANSTSNVRIPTAGGNVLVSVGGTSNVLVATSTGVNVAGTLNATGNANVGNLGTAGNITAAYFFGNGSQLTGITAAATSLANGTSNVTIPASGGNVNTSVGGVSNVQVVTSTGVNVAGTLNATGNTTTGNLIANTQILRNSRNVPTYVYSANTAPSSALAGDLWYNTFNGVLFEYMNDGTTAVWLDIGSLPAISANISNAVTFSVTGNLSAGNILTDNYFYSNGSPVPFGLQSTIANGTSNTSIPASGGNVNTSVGGIANVLVVTTTGVNVAGTLNATGNANAGNIGATAGIFTRVTGSLTTASQPNITSVGTLTSVTVSGNANVGNLGTAGNIIAAYFFGNGSQLTGITATATSIANGTSNVNIPASGGNVNTSVGGVSNVQVVTSTGVNVAGTLNATGNANVGNLGATLVVANLSGSGNSNVGNLGVTGAVFGVHTGPLANGTSNVWIPASGGNINLTVGGTANVLVATTTGVNIAGTLNATGNANIGNLGATLVVANLSGSGNSNVGNLGATLVVANLSGSGNSNVGNLGATAVYANLQGTGNSNVGNLGATGNITASYFFGNGSQLTGISTSIISNGTSNVSIPTANGNVNISSAGNANILIVTGTGINVAGTLNATGNANVGNLGATLVVANLSGSGNSNVGNLGATLVVANLSGSGNSNVGNLGATLVVANLSGSGNSNVGNLGVTGAVFGVHAGPLANGTSNVWIPASGGNINLTVGGTANVLVATTTGINVAGTLNATGNANVGNLGTAGNITAAYFFGNGSQLTGITATATSIANGTSNVTIPASGGNVNTSVGGTANVLVVTTTGVNVAGTLNATGNANVGNLGATLVVANLSGTGNSNVGNLGATLVVANLSGSGNSNVGNLGVTGAVFGVHTGPLANGTSNVWIPASGGNINLTVGGTANVLVATTTGVNIAGTLNTGTGNANVGNLGTTGNITAAYFFGNGSQLTGITAAATSIANGTSNVVIPTANGNVNISSAGNANILVITGTGINVAGTLNTGTGNANVGNLGATLVVANLSGSGNSNVGNLGATLVVANLSGSGNSNVGNLGVTGAVFGVHTGPLANGTSNVWIPASGGNINLTVGGTANVLVATTTGVNVIGTLNTGTGNANVGNLGTTGNITAAYFFGNGSQLTGITATATSIANGTSNVTIPTSGGNVNISVGGNANVLVTTSTGVNVSNKLTVTAATPPSSDMVIITNAGQGVTTAGVNGLNLTYVGGAAAVEASAYRTDFTPGATTGGTWNGFRFVSSSNAASGVTMNAIKIDPLPSVGPGVENAIYVGANWDNILNYNGTAVIFGNGLANAAQLSGTIPSAVTNAITSVGTLSTLIVGNATANTTFGNGIFTATGNANVGNLGATLVVANLSGSGNSNVGNLGATLVVANLSGSGNSNVGNLGVTGAVFGVHTGPLANGTSNVWIPASGGNINLTVGGTANVLVATTTGVNVSGTLNTGTGNANVGNLGATLVVANITGTGNSNVGNLGVTGAVFGVHTGPLANGTSNVWIPTANGNINLTVGGTANVLVTTSTGVNITGTLNSTGNANVGNLGTSGNITAGYYFGNGSQLTGITVSGNLFPVMNVQSANTFTAVAWNHYIITSANATVATMPASPNAGDYIMFSVTNGLANNIINPNGANIQSTSGNMTIDNSNVAFALRYVNATIGWCFS